MFIFTMQTIFSITSKLKNKINGYRSTPNIFDNKIIYIHFHIILNSFYRINTVIVTITLYSINWIIVMNKL